MFSPRVLETLEKLKKEDDLMIVEGVKDRIALKSLGLKNIITISGRPLEEIVEIAVSLKPSQVTILTDFDDEGENIASRLTNLFTHYKIKTNQFIRKKFRSLKIHKIEELNSFTKLMEDDQNGKIGSIYHKIFNRSRIFSRRNSRKTRCDRSDIWSNRRLVGPRSRLKRAPKDG